MTSSVLAFHPLLNPFVGFCMGFSFPLSFESVELFENYFLSFSYYLAIFLINLFSYSYIFIKFFRVLCYSTKTFEWLPMINPYIWPFSMFRILTEPYFRLWSKILPPLRLQNSSLDISGIIALEVLNSVVYISSRITEYLLAFVEVMEESGKLIHFFFL